MEAYHYSLCSREGGLVGSSEQLSDNCSTMVREQTLVLIPATRSFELAIRSGAVSRSSVEGRF
jgi:hypothetical protein